MGKKIRITLLIIGVIATGYFREFLFVNLNEQLRFIYYENEVNYAHSFVQSISSPFSYIQLYWGKWFLTILFALAFMFWAVIGVKILFQNRKYVKITIGLFAALVITSATFYFLGSIINNMGFGYKFARIFMGIAQSPLPLMLLIPAFLLAEKTSKTNH